MSDELCTHTSYCTSGLCPPEEAYSLECGLRDFMDGLLDLKKELNIQPGRGSDKDRKRIAIAVTELFVTTVHDGINKDRILEQEFYENAQGLVCDPIPEEVRASELPTTARKGIDPLKLYPRTAGERHCGRFTRMVLGCLKTEAKGEQNERPKVQPIRIENRPTAYPRFTRRLSKSLQRHPRQLEKKVRSSVCASGVSDLLPRT